MNLQSQKVIKGLECCISEGTDCPEDCPYIGDCNRDKLHSDALALLKAQEPQILLIEDVRKLERTPIWLDVKSTNKYFYKGWALVYVIQNGTEVTERLGITNPSGRMYWYKLDDYGKTWRCWNTKPSKEQMEAEPWND